MAVNQVASGALVIYPKLSESVKSVVSKELAGVNAAPAGKKVGKAYGSSIASAADRPIQGIGASLKSVLGVASGIAAAVGFGGLISEAGEAADATLKFIHRRRYEKAIGRRASPRHTGSRAGREQWCCIVTLRCRRTARMGGGSP